MNTTETYSRNDLAVAAFGRDSELEAAIDAARIAAREAHEHLKALEYQRSLGHQTTLIHHGVALCSSESGFVYAIDPNVSDVQATVYCQRNAPNASAPWRINVTGPSGPCGGRLHPQEFAGRDEALAVAYDVVVGI